MSLAPLSTPGSSRHEDAVDFSPHILNMAPEIADSDAESDVGPHESAPDPTFEGQSAADSQQASLSNVDFDQFIDPTQRLSELSPSADGAGDTGTGSTDRILRGLTHPQIDLAASSAGAQSTIEFKQNDNGTDHTPSNNKRSQSAIDEGSGGTIDHGSKRKRPKTYGSKTRNRSLQSSNLFSDFIQPPPVSPISEDAGSSRQSATGQSGLEDVDGTLDEEPHNIMSRQRDRPRRVVSLLEESARTGSHQFSTSTSSMGGYQSMNLDFRGSGEGDIHANPFWGLSQELVDSKPTETDDIAPHEAGGSAITYDNTVNPAMLMA